MTSAVIWMTIGFLGQALFALRFLVQWLASERAGRSVIPKMFWTISLPAGLALLAYALWRHDPVFSINEGICVLIFARNLLMVRRKNSAVTGEAS